MPRESPPEPGRDAAHVARRGDPGQAEGARWGGMPAGEVLAVLEALTGAGYARVWVAGGWGVDALVGNQSRAHRDLDLAVDVTDQPTGVDLTEALAALGGRGYAVESDWRPSRVEVTASRWRWVDLHPVVFDERGIGWQADLAGLAPFSYPPEALTCGVIADRDVDCLSVGQQLRFHSGYPRAPMTCTTSPCSTTPEGPERWVHQRPGHGSAVAGSHRAHSRPGPRRRATSTSPPGPRLDTPAHGPPPRPGLPDGGHGAHRGRTSVDAEEPGGGAQGSSQPHRVVR